MKDQQSFWLSFGRAVWSYSRRLGLQALPLQILAFQDKRIRIASTSPGVEQFPPEQGPHAVLQGSPESSLLACPWEMGMGKKERPGCPCWNGKYSPPHHLVFCSLCCPRIVLLKSTQA